MIAASRGGIAATAGLSSFKCFRVHRPWSIMHFVSFDGYSYCYTTGDGLHFLTAKLTEIYGCLRLMPWLHAPISSDELFKPRKTWRRRTTPRTRKSVSVTTALRALYGSLGACDCP